MELPIVATRLSPIKTMVVLLPNRFATTALQPNMKLYMFNMRKNQSYLVSYGPPKAYISRTKPSSRTQAAARFGAIHLIESRLKPLSYKNCSIMRHIDIKREYTPTVQVLHLRSRIIFLADGLSYSDHLVGRCRSRKGYGTRALLLGRNL
jgi:hypothetical protein